MSKVQQSFHDFGFPEAIPNKSPLRGEGMSTVWVKLTMMTVQEMVTAASML